MSRLNGPEAGVAVDEELVVDPGGHGASHGFDAVPTLMRRRNRPTGMFAATDFLAIGGLAWCRANGIRVPEDFAIVGSDNIEAANFVDVPLTTVHYAADKVSTLAVDHVLSLMRATDRPRRPEVTLIERELIVRQSCGAFRSRRQTGGTARKPAAARALLAAGRPISRKHEEA